MKQRQKKQQILTLTILSVLILNIIFLNLSVSKQITADYIPLRSSNTIQSDVQELITKDNTLTILKQTGEWSKVFVHNRVGWVLSSELDNAKVNASNTAITVKATQAGVSVFKDTRSTDKELGKLNVETVYLKYFDKNGWSQIVYQNALAWVKSDMIEIIKEPSTISAQQIEAKYPKATIATVTSNFAPLVNDVQTNGIMSNLLKGDEIVLTNKNLTNDYYFGTSLTTELQGYIHSKHVTINENVTQRIGVKSTTLKGSTIVIDAGHGGVDGGAVNSGNHIKEAELTLKTAEILKNVLVNEGVNVIMTRTNDKNIELEERGRLANQHQADVFISLHYDSTEETGPSGTSVHYLRYSDKRLAELFAESFKELPLQSNGIKPSNFVVLRESNAPALLLELGYMNNDSDVKIFNSNEYRQNVAQKILNALKQYFGQ